MIAVRNPDSIFEINTPAGICSILSEKENEEWKSKLLPKKMVQESLKNYGIRG